MSVLALYDFASKQNYIFRSSKVKEIVGASKLIADMYRKFAVWISGAGIDFQYDLEKPFALESFSHEGEVIYDGGGNLMVLYRDRSIYEKANRVISAKLLTEAPSLSLIAACVEVSGNFKRDIKNLYAENAVRKNKYPAAEVSAVTPFTQVDPMTFRPVAYKGTRYTKMPQSMSSDRVSKQKKYKESFVPNSFDEIEEGLVAVIHIDGNSMGRKLMSIGSESYDTGVRYLREFSSKIMKAFVEDTRSSIEAKGYPCRFIVTGGDDMTLICKASDALDVVSAYFASLKESACVVPAECETFLPEEDRANTACAGIAVIHAKSPFILAYELAEAACESAKKKAHEKNGNYFDFYYCHSGATADFDTLRDREQSMTGRPYAIDDIDGMLSKYGSLLNKAGRANVKALGNAAQLGKEAFLAETERVNAYLKSPGALGIGDLKIVYDISEFYDLWFDGTEEENEQDA